MFSWNCTWVISSSAIILTHIWLLAAGSLGDPITNWELICNPGIFLGFCISMLQDQLNRMNVFSNNVAHTDKINDLGFAKCVWEPHDCLYA